MSRARNRFTSMGNGGIAGREHKAFDINTCPYCRVVRRSPQAALYIGYQRLRWSAPSRQPKRRFCSAERVTLVGSTIPAFIISTYSSSRSQPVAFLVGSPDFINDYASFKTGVRGNLAYRLLDSLDDNLTPVLSSPVFWSSSFIRSSIALIGTPPPGTILLNRGLAAESASSIRIFFFHLHLVAAPDFDNGYAA